MVNSFHFTREVRLGLTHQRSAEDRRRLAGTARSMREYTKVFSFFSLQFSAILCVLCGKKCEALNYSHATAAVTRSRISSGILEA
jgi:hypothetical protein